jgi:hypothetical protein
LHGTRNGSSSEQFLFLQGYPFHKFATDPVPILPNDLTTPAGPSSRCEQKPKLIWKLVVGRQFYPNANIGNVVNHAKKESCTFANIDPSRATVVPARMLAQFWPAHPLPPKELAYGRGKLLIFRCLAVCQWPTTVPHLD